MNYNETNMYLLIKPKESVGGYIWPVHGPSKTNIHEYFYEYFSQCIYPHIFFTFLYKTDAKIWLLGRN